MADITDGKTKGTYSAEYETQRVAMTSSMARMRTLRLAKEAMFDAKMSMAAIRRTKAKI